MLVQLNVKRFGHQKTKRKKVKKPKEKLEEKRSNGI
jgi:hypothetical protein